MNRFVSLIVLLAMFCINCFSMNVDQYSNDSVAKEAPKIIEVTSGEKVFRDGYTYLYDYKFDIRYTGCEYVTVGVEQEYSSYYNVYHFYGPDTAHVYVKNLYANNRVWIDISAENEFGSTKMTIELPPYDDSESNGIEEVEVGKDESVARIAVYSVNGTFIANIHDFSELANLNRKIVILKYMDAENKVIKAKTIKQ